MDKNVIIKKIILDLPLCLYKFKNICKNFGKKDIVRLINDNYAVISLDFEKKKVTRVSGIDMFNNRYEYLLNISFNNIFEIENEKEKRIYHIFTHHRISDRVENAKDIKKYFKKFIRENRAKCHEE